MDGFGQIFEQFNHLRRGFKKVIGRHFAPVRFGNVATFGNTKQRVMRFVRGAVFEIAIICSDQGNIVLVGQCNDALFRFVFIGQIVALKLYIETITENFVQAFERVFCMLYLFMENRLRDTAFHATAQTNQAIGILRDVI